ncbi:hypothetical protein GGF42_007640, partial [Coemansia sp. RSA 2424]
MMQQAGQQYQYAHLAQAHGAGQAQMHHQQSIHQAMVGQHSPASQFAPQTGSGSSALLAQQMRRMRQSPAAGGGGQADRSEFGDGREDM